MDPSQDRTIVPISSAELVTSALNGNRILRDMVGEALVLGQEKISGESKKFRIGDYIWCEPDYRQIVAWAEALRMEPLTVIKKLVAGQSKAVKTVFQNGRMLSLSWNLDALPLSDFTCVDGVTLEELELYRYYEPWPKSTEVVTLAIPSLRSFYRSCTTGTPRGITGAKLHLIDVPNLSLLEWRITQLAELNLANVPRLTALICCNQKPSELNLARLPYLSRLEFDCGDLTELNLALIPRLTELGCSFNNLTALNLSYVPSLRKLICGGNKLTELNLAHVPRLSKLGCAANQLTELDLSHLPNLTELYCLNNRIPELDIRPVRNLVTLLYSSDKTRLIQRPDQNF